MPQCYIPIYPYENKYIAFFRYGLGEQRYSDREVLFDWLYKKLVLEHGLNLHNNLEFFYEHRSDKRFHFWKKDMEDWQSKSISNVEGLNIIHQQPKICINVDQRIGNILPIHTIFAFYE